MDDYKQNMIFLQQQADKVQKKLIHKRSLVFTPVNVGSHSHAHGDRVHSHNHGSDKIESLSIKDSSFETIRDENSDEDHGHAHADATKPVVRGK